MSHPMKVSGEDLDTLYGFFAYLETNKEPNGMVHVTAKNVPSSVGTPFVRAVMRREARLLLKDADGMGDESMGTRTAEQRRAEAFADVLLSVAAAVRYIQRDDPVHAELSSDHPSPLPDSS